MTDLAADPRLPRWPLTRWLIDPGEGVPMSVRLALMDSLYGSIPIFIGGVINTVAVSTVIAIAMPTPLFIGWAVTEMLLAIVRLPVLIACRRASREGRRGPTDIALLLALLWSLSVGYGTFITIWSGNWVIAALACLSTAAMVGGICFRNFAAPRMVCAMIFTSLGPVAIAGVTSGEPLMLVTALQVPLYLYAITTAAFRMNRMMVRTMQAELANDHRARHDALTGLLNRSGLAAAVEAQGDAPLACFFIDLDGFKRVNDTLGHHAGDALLAMVAERLCDVAGDGAILARQGGDEYVAIIPHLPAEEARRFGSHIAAGLSSHPYIIEGDGVLIGASVGGALRPDHGHSLTNLIEAADQALYRAKASGASSCVFVGDKGQCDCAPIRAPAKLRLAHG